MSLDPQARQLLKRMEEADVPPVHEMSPEEAREQHVEQAGELSSRGPDVAEVRDERVETDDGEVPVRIYRPLGEGPFPAVVYIHGGGWVVGTLDTFDTVCRELTVRSGALVVSVDYRLAPEHPHPAALDDAFAVVQWLEEKADELDVDARRIGVAGDSAGGMLATLVTIRAREGGGPPLRFQALVYPALDPDLDSESMHEFSEGYYLTREEMRWYWDQYLGDQREQRGAEVTPLHGTSLEGLPPALVIVAGYDPLRDEGIEYAQRLQDAGVPTTLRNYEGMIHGFIRFSGVLDTAFDAIDDLAHFSREVTGSR